MSAYEEINSVDAGNMNWSLYKLRTTAMRYENNICSLDNTSCTGMSVSMITEVFIKRNIRTISQQKNYN